ncbi:beta-propeller fold lactonase family protein, partial [Niveispirillum sp. KHB5.9]|uniref:beta-propeller fold lactonase family protein n=1 Tax=Niveispirillum sp. KHB5.9 TaxID=3400269 RepID=UPI003A892EF3
IRLMQHMPSGGASPRFCLMVDHERQLVVANEEGDCVTLFEIRADGTPAPSHATLPLNGAAWLLSMEGGDR